MCAQHLPPPGPNTLILRCGPLPMNQVWTLQRVLRGPLGFRVSFCSGSSTALLGSCRLCCLARVTIGLHGQVLLVRVCVWNVSETAKGAWKSLVTNRQVTRCSSYCRRSAPSWTGWATPPRCSSSSEAQRPIGTASRQPALRSGSAEASQPSACVRLTHLRGGHNRL